ncbi:hypothetical protein Tco_1525481 [Tanacetum coccineum]
MEESMNKFMAESVKIHNKNSILIKEIRSLTDATIRNQGALIKALEIQIRQMSKRSSIRRIGQPEQNADFQAKSINYSFSKSLTNDCYDDMNVLDSATYGVFKEGQRMEDQALADLGASVRVMLIMTFTNLGLGDLAPTKLTVELADRTIKYPKGGAENVLVGIGERMKLDLKARLMEEALMINRSQDPSFEDFIELNDLNTPVKLRRNQVKDLGLTIGEGEVIDEPMIDIFKTRNNESFDKYPSLCDFDRKIHIDCAYNLRFSCMIVVENMDGYQDQDIGDVIFGEPFCKASCVEARRNSAYFHKVLKSRTNRCKVEEIYGEDNVRYTGDQEACRLITEVSNKEIKEAMFDIDDNKDPRLDGFTAKFFIKSQDVIADDVCQAVNEKENFLGS